MATAAAPSCASSTALTLQEHDTAYVGQPREFTVDPYDGSYYVADRLAERVLRFDRRGVLRLLYGRKGRGPGEITGIGPMLVTDSSLYVSASENARIERFDRGSGAASGAFRVSGYVTSFVRDGDEAWIGSYDPERPTSVSVWETGTQRLRHLVPIPAEYERSARLGGSFPGVFVAPFGDSLLVGFMGTPYIVVATREGMVTDTVSVPLQPPLSGRHRRGDAGSAAGAIQRSFSALLRTASADARTDADLLRRLS